MRPYQRNRHKKLSSLVGRLVAWAPGHLRTEDATGRWVASKGSTERRDEDKVLTRAVRAMPEELRWIVFAHYLMGWDNERCAKQASLDLNDYVRLEQDAHMWLSGYLAAAETTEGD
jgi:hypothetical protein